MLTEQRRAELIEHLRGEFGDAAETAVGTIEQALVYSSAVKAIPASKLRAVRKSGKARSLAVARHAGQLRDLLRVSQPVYRTAGIDWKALDITLASVSKAAALEAAAWGSKGGRPPLEWRDALIAIVASLYPASRVARERRHLRATIEILLRFMKHEVEDIDGVIMDALKRKAAYRQN